MTDQEIELAGYGELLSEVKALIGTTRVAAALTVNQRMIVMYWEIGREILARQDDEGYGTKVVDRLANDLKTAFPNMTGLGTRNLKYMRAFAAAWSDQELVQQLLHNLPWGHHVALLNRLDDAETRLWYAGKALENNWSRNVLEMQLKSELHKRIGAAPSNMLERLPKPQGDLAQAITKDPYMFEFLALAEDAQERHVEAGLLEQLRKTMLEFGEGFAFVGSQYTLEVGDQDYRLDLLFFHFRLNCFVVVDLKIDAFTPEQAGKMNFYVAAVDDQLRNPDRHEPTIGVIVCRDSNKTIVEYALRDLNKPIAVSTYITSVLPPELQETLPSAQVIDAELDEVEVGDGDEEE